MAMPRKITTPNARLLYKISKKTGRDWQKILLQLDTCLEKSPLQRANPFVCLYYFLPTTNSRFFQEKSWVCREVIGPPRLDDNPDFYLHDLTKTWVWSTPWDNGLEKLVFKKLWKWENDIRKTLPPPLADTWCLQIAVEEKPFLSVEMRHFSK